MDVKEALQKRRSIRKFTDQIIDDEKINILLHAAMSGPSACNARPWDFIVVTNNDLLEELKKATRFTKITSKLAIVVCGNMSKALPMQLAPYWIQDCSAATMCILLQATELGLGTLWCGIHPQKRAEERVRKMLDLSDKQIPLNIIYIGYPDESKDPRDQYDEKRVTYKK